MTPRVGDVFLVRSAAWDDVVLVVEVDGSSARVLFLCSHPEYGTASGSLDWVDYWLLDSTWAVRL